VFGLDGTFVEAMRDVTFRIAPMWESSAENLISSIKAYRMLRGIRARPPSDIKPIKDCMLRLSQLVTDHPEIAELDINRLIVYPEGGGCVVADSRMVLVTPQSGEQARRRAGQWAAHRASGDPQGGSPHLPSPGPDQAGSPSRLPPPPGHYRDIRY